MFPDASLVAELLRLIPPSAGNSRARGGALSPSTSRSKVETIGGRSVPNASLVAELLRLIPPGAEHSRAPGAGLPPAEQ